MEKSHVRAKFADRLFQLRRERNLTQTKVAELNDMSQARVAAYENRKNVPLIFHLVTLATFFEVTTDYLLGITDDRK